MNPQPKERTSDNNTFDYIAGKCDWLRKRAVPNDKLEQYLGGHHDAIMRMTANAVLGFEQVLAMYASAEGDDDGDSSGQSDDGA